MRTPGHAYSCATILQPLKPCVSILSTQPHLGLIAAGIGPGDEVITTPMTFAASVNVILHSGATPVFVDASVPDMTMDVNQIEDKITPRTRAIMPIHFAGRPCNMDAIMDIAHRHDLLVMEDAAHAVEAMYHGRKIGNIGHLTCFSFYVTKNIVTGEGGMITSNNDEWAEKIQVYGLHGMSKGAWQRYSDDGYKHYAVVYPGYKYNMMDIQAAIGIHQLERIEIVAYQSNWGSYVNVVGKESEFETTSTKAVNLLCNLTSK